MPGQTHPWVQETAFMSKKVLNIISGTMIAALVAIGSGFAMAADTAAPAKKDDKAKAATPVPAKKKAHKKAVEKKKDEKPAAAPAK